ncbi:MAG: hypothetical protein R6W97_01460 [Thiobacillus sp.]
MIAFKVPSAEHSVLQQAFETRPKATAEWLGRLPVASPVDTAQQLVMALYALNRQPLSEDARHALLALYRPVVKRAANSLESLLAESGVPPHAQQRQNGVLLRELLIEHSIGYKHLLLALGSRRFGRNPARRIAEVTAHLLAAQQHILTACHLTYSPPPNGLWLEMHQLYQQAHTTGIDDLAWDDARPAGLVYRQALLLALADPPHMSHAELTHTRLYLEKFGALATLDTALDNPAHHGFAIPSDSDPCHSPLTTRGAAENTLWLGTDALCQHLRDTGTRLRSGHAPRRVGLPQGMESPLSLSLCKRLLKLWRNPTQRAYKRYPSSGKAVQLVAGVSAIHYLLELGLPAADPGEKDADSMTVHDGGPIVDTPVAIHSSHWAIDNDSAAGLALSGVPDAPLNLKVGDALAMRADAAAPWSLAVIRWLKMHDARQVELGIERLSPEVRPVWVRPLRGKHTSSPEPALFVPGIPALQKPDRLLLPRHLYHPGMDAEVWHAPRQFTLTFGRRVEHTPSFDLVDFTLFTDEPPP